VGGIALAGVVGTACDGGSSEDLSRSAQVYVATIREVVGQQPPLEEPDALAVVYVMPVGETTIGADVQAEVVGELRDDADVRFADERAEAVEEDGEGEPVRDGGVLVAVGELTPEGDPVVMEVEVYRSELDWSKTLLTFAERSSQWTVTSSSVLPTS